MQKRIEKKYKCNFYFLKVFNLRKYDNFKIFIQRDERYFGVWILFYWKFKEGNFLGYMLNNKI